MTGLFTDDKSETRQDDHDSDAALRARASEDKFTRFSYRIRNQYREFQPRSRIRHLILPNVTNCVHVYVHEATRTLDVWPASQQNLMWLILHTLKGYRRRMGSDGIATFRSNCARQRYPGTIHYHRGSPELSCEQVMPSVFIQCSHATYPISRTFPWICDVQTTRSILTFYILN